MPAGFAPKLREALRKSAVARIPSTAAGSTEQSPVFAAKDNVTVHSATYIPDTDVTADATNNFTLTLENWGSDGATGTEDAVGTAVSGSSAMSQMVEQSFAVSDVDIEEGDVLVAAKTEAGTGQTQPAGVVVIEYSVRP